MWLRCACNISDISATNSPISGMPTETLHGIYEIQNTPNNILYRHAAWACLRMGHRSTSPWHDVKFKKKQIWSQCLYCLYNSKFGHLNLSNILLKLLPPDVRFYSKNAQDSISAGHPPQTLPESLQHPILNTWIRGILLMGKVEMWMERRERGRDRGFC